jgi:hypothetical protein
MIWNLKKNKGINAINISNILNRKEVVKEIPPYFKNQSVPIVSYSYTYVAQGSYMGAPVVYITHFTMENIKLSKKIHSLSFTEWKLQIYMYI